MVFESFGLDAESASRIGVEDWLPVCSGGGSCALLAVTLWLSDKRFFLLACSAALKPGDFLGGARAPHPPPNLRGSVEASVLDAAESSEGVEVRFA